jgi:hypothetical protein
VNLDLRVLLGSSSELPLGFALRKNHSPAVYLMEVGALRRDTLRAFSVAGGALSRASRFIESRIE